MLAMGVDYVDPYQADACLESADRGSVGSWCACDNGDASSYHQTRLVSCDDLPMRIGTALASNKRRKICD